MEIFSGFLNIWLAKDFLLYDFGKLLYSIDYIGYLENK